MKLKTNPTFDEALKILNILDYKSQIWYSNSHGELFHCRDYITMAKILGEENIDWFRPWFLAVVKEARKWDRPASIYQHIGTILQEQCKKSL